MSDQSADQQKVLIIGAGPGGLVLAQILHANGIPYEIFERDADLDHSRKGWAVALMECIPELQKVLPKSTYESLPALSVNYNVAPTDEVAFVDAVTGDQVGLVGGGHFGEHDYVLRVCRDTLRAHMWNSNNIAVTSGCKFTHYEEDEAGVTAFFSDGSSAHGAMLVGADGAHSHVRDQLIGADHQPELSAYVPIFGQAHFPRSVVEPVLKLGNAVVLAGAKGIRLMIGLMRMDSDGESAELYWALMNHTDNEQERKEFADWVSHKANQEQLLHKALQIVEDAGLHETMVAPIREGGIQGIFMPQPPFLEFVSPESLPRGRVTLLGDAAHAMIPLRGAGANTAISDACLLGSLIAASKKILGGPADGVADLLQEYSQTMLPRGRETVLSSRAAGEVGEEEGNPAKAWASMFAKR